MGRLERKEGKKKEEICEEGKAVGKFFLHAGIIPTLVLSLLIEEIKKVLPRIARILADWNCSVILDKVG